MEKTPVASPEGGRATVALAFESRNGELDNRRLLINYSGDVPAAHAAMRAFRLALSTSYHSL